MFFRAPSGHGLRLLKDVGTEMPRRAFPRIDLNALGERAQVITVTAALNPHPLAGLPSERPYVSTKPADDLQTILLIPKGACHQENQLLETRRRVSLEFLDAFIRSTGNRKTVNRFVRY
jgi:hypothetical protein